MLSAGRLATPASDEDVVRHRGAHMRHMARRFVSERPSLYLPLARRRYPGPSPMVITRDTQIVIDGYTRSATTYAVYAFQLAQPASIRIAHHLHAPAQIVTAVRWGIPTLLLIREPEGAVLSQVVREPGVTVRDALVSWSRFYEIALRHREGFVVGEFSRVTTDLAGLILDVNQRFGSTFATFEATEAYECEVFGLMGERPTTIPEWAALLHSFESGLISREQVLAGRERFQHEADRGARPTWMPSQERDAAKARLAAEWGSPSLSRERDRALRVFARVMERS